MMKISLCQVSSEFYQIFKIYHKNKILLVIEKNLCYNKH